MIDSKGRRYDTPVVVGAMLACGVGLRLSSVVLLMFGTQWYILFNVIAGATAIPRELWEVSRVGRDALPVEVPEDFDLLTEGVIDSLGLVELIASLEERLGVEVDFAELDADDLTKVGPLAAYVEAKSNAG